MSEGRCGDVDLTGALFLFALSWPGAIHEGNGTVAVFCDPSTTPEQREALGAIVTNQYGGNPHEIFASTFTTVLGPFVEPIEATFDGTRSSIRIGDKVSAAMKPHLSPVEPSEEQEVHVVLPGGFIFKDGRAARARVRR